VINGNSDAQATLITLAAAAQGTFNSPDMQNPDGRGVKVVLDLTTMATASLVAKIQGKDPVSGKYYDLLASAEKTSTGTTILTVYPGVAAVSNVSASDVLPATWRVNIVVTDNVGTAAVTGTVGASTQV
jgi:hypothetical protein